MISFSSNGNSGSHNWDELSTVIKAPKGQGCPKCDGFVYHADQGRRTKRERDDRSANFERIDGLKDR